MKKIRLALAVMLVVFSVSVLILASDSASGSSEDVMAYGERLIHNMDCKTCHTPKIFTPEGPQNDISRLLPGHPAKEKLQAIPEGQIGPEGWGGFFKNSLTAWVGPWGVSFGSNLTPDHKTGIGNWTEDIFIEAMRTGMHVGSARPFLPPMPTYSRLTDEELRAMYTY